MMIKGLSGLTMAVIVIIITIIIGFFIVSGIIFQFGRGSGLGSTLTCDQALKSMCADFVVETNGFYDEARYGSVLYGSKSTIERSCKREEIYNCLGKPNCIVDLNNYASVVVFCCGKVGGDISVCQVRQQQTGGQQQSGQSGSQTSGQTGGSVPASSDCEIQGGSCQYSSECSRLFGGSCIGEYGCGQGYCCCVVE